MGFEDLPAETVLMFLYHYIPSKPAAIAAAVLYAVISVAVAAVTVKTRTYYMLTVGVTGILELIGEHEVHTTCVCLSRSRVLSEGNPSLS